MIQPARFPRALRAGGLHALHVSLNSPVVAHESLPRGPASAAVALDADGALVCLRSVRTGRRVFFCTAEELAPSPRLALDAALSFAEGLGFLFDEDELRLRGDEAALDLWVELCGDSAPASPRLDADDLETDDDGEDLWGDDDLFEAAEPTVAHALSKFRFTTGRA